MPIELIVWTDSKVFGDSELTSDEIEGHALMSSVGYVIKETGEDVVIARDIHQVGMELGGDPNIMQYRGVLAIPKVNITSREEFPPGPLCGGANKP